MEIVLALLAAMAGAVATEAGKGAWRALAELRRRRRDSRGTTQVAGRRLETYESAMWLHRLPADIASFTGRDDAWRQLTDLVGDGGAVAVTVIDGMAGIGKTTFAVHAAHRLAERFPDGRLFVRLHGHTPGQRPVEPADALTALLQGTGVPSGRIPADLEARAALWRERMSGKKAIVLLDDAAGSTQVRPLLPGAPETLVLVTSRRRLAALPDAAVVSLDVLSPGEAARLFVQLSGRTGLVCGDGAVAQTVAACGFLPLAISLAAGQLKHHPSWQVADLVEELTSAAEGLSGLRAENVSVSAVFDLSYHNLPPAQRGLFRRLGLHFGQDIDAYAAAALAGTDLRVTRCRLAEMFGHHLLNEPARGRYRFHDLIRQHARSLAAADDTAQSEAAVVRLLDHYLHTVRAADRHLNQGLPVGVPEAVATRPPHLPELDTWAAAVAWMEAERANLHAATAYAAEHGKPEHAVAIPTAMLGFLRVRGHWHEALALYRIALQAACRISDPRVEASVLNDLGVLRYWTGDRPAATAHLTRALELYRGVGDRLGEANVLTNLGPLQTGERVADGLTRALWTHRAFGNRVGEADTLIALGRVRHRTGDDAQAVADLTLAMRLHGEIGNRLREASALHTLGYLQQQTGDHRTAMVSLMRAREMYYGLGDPLGEALASTAISELHRQLGDDEAALADYDRAHTLFRRIGHPKADLMTRSSTTTSGSARNFQARTRKSTR